ncbi:MAG: DegT/DnrJ/EryC1/StrS family aminotransferase [Pseudomonadales bacterium]|jgi:dTDP-4-amino-4,6-dideoxygalactose transaminase|nr:DegT/DnrJ/EryC1/StrS family aminotransferase [Pseudomonadales bacterium]MDP7357560.1 DegT/DnrJ/EryC1/StrS family aminotransferase [Pseudomonadales bacterium]MDP7596552.1 DegT/DnrJ/EryC1/StrS family aminotransferase [Pseudomonadales bacterium]HJN51077.1 DegT/DnrJ/EryC1/StrS family aminotransferase [Pseudomonadales bacterium]
MAQLAVSGGPRLRQDPFPSWPQWGDADKEALTATLDSGHWGGYPPPSPRAAQFEQEFAAYHDSAHAVTLASGTDALMVALRGAGIGPGDEVIVPALTFIASASAILLVGATPVFVDVDPTTYCIKTTGSGGIEAATTNRTRGILPVHLGSRMANMSWIDDFADRKDLLVVEDCAHMHGGAWDGKGIGSSSTCAAFSFQASKLLTAGEGGAISTNDAELAEKARYFINSGRLGPMDPIRRQALGWSMRLTEFQAALLHSQFVRMVEEQAPVRERNKARLHSRLGDLAGVEVLRIDARETRRSGYAYIFKYLEDQHEGVSLSLFTKALRAEGIPCSGSMYQPVYKNPLFPLSEAGVPLFQDHLEGTVDYREVLCPESERAAYHENVWIPHEVFLGSLKDTDDIADAIEKVINNLDELRGGSAK